MKLISLLNSFDENENRRFGKFIRSDYFNTDQYVIKLFDLLGDQVIKKTSFDIAIQGSIFKQLNYKNEKVSAFLNIRQSKILHAKMSALLKLARMFLCNENLIENPACERELYYQKLLNKRQYNLLQYHLKKDSKSIHNASVKGTDHYALSFKVETNRLHLFHQTGKLLAEDNLPKLIETLDLYYLLNKLSLQLAAITLQNASAKKRYNFASMDATLALLELPPYCNHPLVQIYRCTFDILQKENDEHYQNLLNLLDIYADVLPRNNLNDFYLVAGNYCALKIRKGKLKYNQKLFELYKILDHKKLMLETGFMPVKKLKNAVTLSCKVKEFDWAKLIVDKYRNNLKREERASVVHFNLGTIAYYQHNFKEAIHHFIRVDKINLAYDLDCKIMLLKSHYELDREYDERTMKIFRTAEQFIKNNNSLPTLHKQGYRNLIRTTIQLYRYRHAVGKRSLENIQAKLEGFEIVGDRQWLEDKIKALNDS